MRLIEEDRKYFILTGSDPSDPFGCCPSEEVAQANRLVRAGILSPWRQGVSSEGCPVTIYAFRGELQLAAGAVQFHPEKAFRERVRAAMEKRGGQTAMSIARWVLLLFVAVSLLFAFFKMKAPAAGAVDLQSWFGQLNPAHEDQVMLLLFHYDRRCRQCRNMENYTRDVLETHFRETVSQDKLRFRLINMDEDANGEASRQLGLFSATLLLVSSDSPAGPEIRIIREAWTLYDDEEKFKEMIRKELEKALADTDD